MEHRSDCVNERINLKIVTENINMTNTNFRQLHHTLNQITNQLQQLNEKLTTIQMKQSELEQKVTNSNTELRTEFGQMKTTTNRLTDQISSVANKTLQIEPLLNGFITETRNGLAMLLEGNQPKTNHVNEYYCFNLLMTHLAAPIHVPLVI